MRVSEMEAAGQQGSSWVKEADKGLHVPFYLDDGSARVLVDPQGAEIGHPSRLPGGIQPFAVLQQPGDSGERRRLPDGARGRHRRERSRSKSIASSPRMRCLFWERWPVNSRDRSKRRAGAHLRVQLERAASFSLGSSLTAHIRVTHQLAASRGTLSRRRLDRRRRPVVCGSGAASERSLMLSPRPGSPTLRLGRRRESTRRKPPRSR